MVMEDYINHYLRGKSKVSSVDGHFVSISLLLIQDCENVTYNELHIFSTKILNTPIPQQAINGKALYNTWEVFAHSHEGENFQNDNKLRINLESLESIGLFYKAMTKKIDACDDPMAKYNLQSTFYSKIEAIRMETIQKINKDALKDYLSTELNSQDINAFGGFLQSVDQFLGIIQRNKVFSTLAIQIVEAMTKHDLTIAHGLVELAQQLPLQSIKVELLNDSGDSIGPF